MPYNPQVSPVPFRADMSGWGAALMQMLGEKNAKQEREAEQNKMEAKEFKTYSAMWEQMGGDKNWATGKDSATLKGAVEGKMMKTKLDEAVANFQKHQSQQASGDALTQAVSMAAGQKQALALSKGQGPIIPEAVTSQDVLQNIFGRAPGAVHADQTVNLVNAMQRGEALTADTRQGGLEFITSPTGATVAREKKTGQFQYDPVSRTEAEANRTRFTVEPIMDRFGRQAGYGVKAQFGSEAEAKAWADKQNQTTGGTTAQYKSADEVKAALKAGTLTKEAALKILREQFKMK